MKIYFKKVFSVILPFYRKALEQNLLLSERLKKKDNMLRDIHEKYYNLQLKYEIPELASTQWLRLMEYKYGGLVKGVKRDKVSYKDPRTKDQIAQGGMVGGDRMGELDHDYGPVYSKHLKPFVDYEYITLVEVGVLLGTGLAIWSDIWKKGRIIGLDIDLGHIMNNMENLKSRGAFTHSNIELYEYDQFLDNREYLADILKKDLVDIVIDDGNHQDKAILNTLSSFIPYLNDYFLYIIEDNHTVHKQIKVLYPQYQTLSYGPLTIIKP